MNVESEIAQHSEQFWLFFGMLCGIVGYVAGRLGEFLVRWLFSLFSVKTEPKITSSPMLKQQLPTREWREWNKAINNSPTVMPGTSAPVIFTQSSSFVSADVRFTQTKHERS